MSSMARGLNYNRLAAAVVLGLCVGMGTMAYSAPAAAQTQVAEIKRYDLPAGTLDDALKQFGRQSGAQLMAPPELVAGHRTKAIRGEFTGAEALDRLLQGTGLSWERIPSGAIVINKKKEAMPETSRRPRPTSDAVLRDEAITNLPEILVVGSRSQNVDIQRTEDDPQPYVVFEKEEIENSLAGNLEDFLRTRLPMNTQRIAGTQQSAGTPRTAPTDNRSAINLRGLGPVQTLILVDGRRVPRLLSENGDAFVQSDINGIPLSAIERIEVLPATASGIYGGGAVGGVINIIRKRDYAGIDLRMTYDGAFRGGTEASRAELSGGFSPDNGTTQISFSALQSDANPLYLSDNDLWRRGRELYVRNDLNQSPVPGATPNIQAAFDFACFCIPDLVLDDGTPLGSSHTFVPVDYPGSVTSGDGGAAFIGNAGQYNIELSNDVFGRRAILRGGARTRSGNINIRRSFTDSVDAFADFSISDNRSRGRTAGGSSYIGTVLADAPNNPFRQNLTVYFPATGLDRLGENKTESMSATAGLIARFGGGWTAHTEYGWSKATTKSMYVASPTTDLAPAAIASGELDVLRDINAFPLEYASFLNADPFLRSGPFRNIQQLGSIRVSGPIMDLPGGQVIVTGVAEYRDERADLNKSTSLFLTIVNPARSQSVGSGYVELHAPLVSEAMNIPLVRELQIQASVRYDHYATKVRSPGQAFLPTPDSPMPDFVAQRTSDDATSYTLALKWAPIADLSLRGSYATGFLPPTISSLVASAPQGGFIGSYRDPRRGNEFVGLRAPYQIQFGGNSDLGPERSKSISAGIVFSPTAVPGLRLAVDYLTITKSDEVGTVGVQMLLARESDFPGRVLRDAPLPEDPTDFLGPVTFVDATYMNLESSRVKAIDTQAEYAFDTKLGRFRAYAVVSRQIELKKQILAEDVPFTAVDKVDGPLKWRGNAGLDWDVGSWMIAWNMQYYNSYSLRFANPEALVSSEIQVALNGRERIPAQAYHDIAIRYRLDSDVGNWARGLEFGLGVANVFDKKPPVIADGFGGGYSTLGDPRLRRYMLTVSKHFGK